MIFVCRHCSVSYIFVVIFTGILLLWSGMLLGYKFQLFQFIPRSMHSIIEWIMRWKGRLLVCNSIGSIVCTIIGNNRSRALHFMPLLPSCIQQALCRPRSSTGAMLWLTIHDRRFPTQRTSPSRRCFEPASPSVI